MTSLEILKAARELLSDESRWTKEASARTAEGDDTTALSTEATCWCMDGAMARVLGGLGPSTRDAYSGAARALSGAIHDGIGVVSSDGFIAFNDEVGTTHADMLAAFDRAIAALETES